MTEEKKQDNPKKRIDEKQRFTYIGFEVFPGNPKDIFKSDAERKELIEAAAERRSKGDTIRETCTLMEERVSFVDRLVLTLSCVVVFAALFLPWYSVYNEIVEEVQEPANEVISDSTALVSDSAMLAQLEAVPDSLSGDLESRPVEAKQQEASEAAATGRTRNTDNEELIHGYVAKKKVHREYSRISGLGSVLYLGSIGSFLFSSGGVLIVTMIVFLLYTLACIGLPAYTLYGLYGTKGDDDSRALQLKKIVKLNWIPTLLFLSAMILSFIGADYGFDSEAMFTSIGRSYGPGVFFNTLSWGVFVSMGGSILLAVKGSEI